MKDNPYMNLECTVDVTGCKGGMREGAYGEWRKLSWWKKMTTDPKEFELDYYGESYTYITRCPSGKKCKDLFCDKYGCKRGEEG
ncbi:hypothetical protein [Paludifilum halophilum]|uniref:Uncharacterized protein n=1 Tax=Paludifilum halophilum TaxID=1642702 RepID=A0A235B1D7_9BACL|nr:hypothetical protein [Paludifilum halophilum]OYD06116.1 hypothetical protein CHM34_18025 [Paludifilum halophilum]